MKLGTMNTKGKWTGRGLTAIGLLMLLATATACSMKTDKAGTETAKAGKATAKGAKKGKAEDIACCPLTICLQPMGNFTQKEATKLKKELEEKLPPVVMWDVECEVWPAIPLADSLRNDAKTRYRADKILRALMPKANKHTVVVGLTHQDISCTLRDRSDWGIQGLGKLGRNTCVVSTFRLKNKADLWKLTTHELIHTIFSYNHCPKNDPTCIIQNANGHPDYTRKDGGLCDYCKKKIHGGA